jgi:hypothetical protein
MDTLAGQYKHFCLLVMFISLSSYYNEKSQTEGSDHTRNVSELFLSQNCLPALRCGTKSVHTSVKCRKLFDIFDSLAALLDAVIFMLLHWNTL